MSTGEGKQQSALGRESNSEHWGGEATVSTETYFSGNQTSRQSYRILHERPERGLAEKKTLRSINAHSKEVQGKSLPS